MTHQLRYIILFFSILSAKIAVCQTQIEFQYSEACPDSLAFSDSSLTEDALNRVLFQKGYPYATLENKRSALGQIRKYRVDCGPRINYVTILWQDSTNLDMEGWNRKSILWKDVVTQREQLLTTLANKGYPYARLLTKEHAIKGDTLVLDYRIDTIRRIFLREVKVEGEFAMNPALFSEMTHVKAGQPFDLDRIERSQEIIRLWDFARLDKMEYDFNPFSVDLIYHVEPELPSRFDLLIGLVPSNQVGKKYEITGNAYLDVRNQFKLAERIYLKFDKYANSSQSFDLRFDFPYLPLIRSGVLAEGLIDRRDSSVLDVLGRLGVQYQWNPVLKYAFFLQRDQSRLIGVNTGRLKISGQLPEELDYNYSAAGINLTLRRLDNIVNPRKGRVISGTLTGGLKRLVRNAQIASIELPEEQPSFQLQYDSLSIAAVKSEVDVSWDQYIPLGDYSSFRIRAMGGWTWSTAALYKNEERRLGGFQDFRGFPEKSFRADAYGVLTGEYRFLFGSESNAYIFSDFGFIHQPGIKAAWNFPHSIGVGLNLGTRAGIFGISYSLGGQLGQPISLDQSRVNFGLMVNY